DRVIGLEIVDRRRDLLEHAERQRIEHFRAVQRDNADRAFGFDNDVFERAHDPPRRLIAPAMCPLAGWASSGGIRVPDAVQRHGAAPQSRDPNSSIAASWA